jgi:hypothetical protein
MTKPSSNNQPCGDLADYYKTTVEEPQQDTVVDLSFQRLVGNDEELVRLKLELTDDRKKRDRYEVYVKGLVAKFELCKRKLESSEATRIADGKKHKGEISASKIKEKAALDAASTSSKLVDVATKEVIGTKAKKIIDMRKQINDLQKEIKNGKTLQGKADRLKAEVDALVDERAAWKAEKKTLSSSNKSLTKQANLQLDARYKHQQRMAELNLEVKQVALEQSKQKKKQSEDRTVENFNAKKAFHTWNYEQREKQKEKELQRKEDVKEKKARKVADRLQIVSSDMLRSTNRINGGTFPSPGLGLQEVSFW